MKMFLVTTSPMRDVIAEVHSVYYGDAVLVISADSSVEAKAAGLRKLMEIDKEYYVKRQVRSINDLGVQELTGRGDRGVVAMMVGEN